MSLCIQLVAAAYTGKAAQETISIIEFYNNGTFGSGYEKALAGAVVTISNVDLSILWGNAMEYGN